MVVLSFDLSSKDTSGLVVEADICARILLPGKEDEVDEQGGTLTGQIVDICVCSLSLMSTNWVGCVRECWRILRMGWVAFYFVSMLKLMSSQRGA